MPGTGSDMNKAQMLAELAGEMDEQSSQYLTSLNELNNAKQLVRLASQTEWQPKVTRKRLFLLTSIFILFFLTLARRVNAESAGVACQGIIYQYAALAGGSRRRSEPFSVQDMECLW